MVYSARFVVLRINLGLINMLKSFTHIKMKPGTEKSSIKKILTIPEALEVHLIAGEFDLLVVLGVEEVLTAKPWEQLTEILTEKIRMITGVLGTQTIIPTSSKIKKNYLFELSKLARGFIYIDVKPGREASVMQQLFQIDEVREVHLVPGEHDILAVVEVRKTVLPPRYPDLIERVVVNKISKINDVQETETIIPVASNFKE